MKRREFIAGLGTTAAWPLVALFRSNLASICRKTRSRSAAGT
jgi:hypothetical protein